MTPDERCAVIASSQYGLLNVCQARAAGLSERSIARRLEQRRWHRVLPAVYRISGTPASWEQDVMAACLWAGEGAAASHRAAARLWRLDNFSGAPVEISVTRHKRSERLGFQIHRVNRFLIPETDSIRGTPVTSVRRTLLDLAGIRHPRVERAIDQSIFRELTSLGELWLLYEEEWTRGRRGIAILRSLLVDRTVGAAPTQSDLEALMMKIIRAEGLPEPERQYEIELPGGPIHVDFCYPAARLVIETDGYAWHSDRAAFEADRLRDNELQSLGWRALRFTWARLRFEAASVADMVRSQLLLPSGK